VAPFPLTADARDRCAALLERSCGLCPGGLERDLPPGWTDSCRKLAEGMPSRIDALEELLTYNRIWKKRTVGVGVLAPELAVELGVTGPLLRAGGLAWDLRRDRPYEIYGRLDFEVPVGANGDTYDRYLVRVAEMRQSVRILIQCLDGIPDGPVIAAAAAGPRSLVAGAGAEVYHGIEGPRGETGFYLVGDGTPNPFRCHARAPSFLNLQALRESCRGVHLGDLMALVGSADIGLAEVDR
jgi:NADH-quinone oxidoreductase subunit D